MPNDAKAERPDWHVMKTWHTSLDDHFGGAEFRCVYPLTEREVEHVLAWLDLIRKQVSRFALTEGVSGPAPAETKIEKEKI